MKASDERDRKSHGSLSGVVRVVGGVDLISEGRRGRLAVGNVTHIYTM